jgi:hypothetical protein
MGVTPKPFFNFISKKVEKILGYSAEEWVQNETFCRSYSSR